MPNLSDRFKKLVDVVTLQHNLLNQKSEELKTAATVVNTHSVAIKIILRALRNRDPELGEDLKIIFSKTAEEIEGNDGYSSDHLRSYVSFLEHDEEAPHKPLLRVVPSRKTKNGAVPPTYESNSEEDE